MKKLLSSLIVSAVVVAALVTFEPGRQSLASPSTPLNTAQRNGPPLTRPLLEEWLALKARDGYIASYIGRNGIAFRPTAELLARLGTMGYYRTRRALAERLPQPPSTPDPAPKRTPAPDKPVGAQQKDPAPDPNAVIILVAKFRGIEPEKYLVADTIIRELRAATSGYPDIIVQPLDETITEQTGSKGGSAYAREVGTKRRASVVLWGYYGVTSERVAINVYFEVLRAPRLLLLRQNFETQTLPVDALNRFEIQTRLSREMTYLVLLTVGIARYESGDYKGAIERFTKALAPSDVPEQIVSPHKIYLFRGFSYYLKDGEAGIDPAIADYDKGIQLKPDLPEAYLIRGWLYSLKPRHDPAIADFDAAIKLKPDFADAYFSRGASYSDKGLYDRAIADFDTTIRLKPDYFLAYFNRANAFSEKGLHDRAIADYDTVIKLKPDYVEAYNNRGVVYGKMEQYDRAMLDFNRAITINPAHANAYVNRGRVHARKGLHDLAVTDYGMAIKLNPGYAFSYQSRGTLYFGKGQYELAIADFDKVIELVPGDAEAHYNRALVYARKGQYDRAVDGYSKAIELKPDLSGPYNNRGVAYTKTGRYDLAIADFDKAIKLSPDSAQGYVNRAVVLHAKGEVERAVADLEHALRLTNDPSLRRVVEQALRQLGVR